jgi:hypothetical protein
VRLLLDAHTLIGAIVCDDPAFDLYGVTRLW